METTINDRKLGMIMGALIGDALGSQYEFYSKNTIKQKYKDNNNMIDFFTTPNYLFNPSYNIVKNTGELSDDGQLIMALIHYLQTNIKPSIEPYKKWFSVNPDDMGITIHQALETGIPSKTSKSNGPLMKVMPWLLLSDKLSIETLLKYIEIDCKFTHTNSELIFNLLYYSMCLYLAITNKYCKDLKIFNHEIVSLIYNILEKVFPNYKIYNSFYNEFTITDNKNIDYLTNRGYCRIALLNAIYQLNHADSYEECIENTILQGGDTDTNACIAGALYGAIYGINMIPKKWQDIVKNAKSSLGSDYEPKNIEELIHNINNKEYSDLKFYSNNLTYIKAFKLSNIVKTILSKQNIYKTTDNKEYNELYNKFKNILKYGTGYNNFKLINIEYLNDNLENNNLNIAYLYKLLIDLPEIKNEKEIVLIMR